MEQVVGFRMRALGNDKVVKAAKDAADSLKPIVKQLDLIAKKVKEVDRLTAALKKLKTASNAAGRASSSTTSSRPSSSSSGGTGSPKKTNDEAKELQRTLAQVRKELKALGDDGSDEFKALVAEAAKFRKEQTEINKAIRVQQREFEKVEAAAGSYRALNAELVSLRDQYRQLGKAEREGIAGQETLKRIGELDTELKDIDKNMGIYVRNVGNYRSAWNGVTSVVSRFAGLVGVGLGLEEIIQNNRDISESQADVAKTTGQTIDQVRELQGLLSERDSRTSLADQLAIGEIGGRLDIAQQDLFSFIDSIDKANVSLGDVFTGGPEEVAETLGLIRNGFKDLQSEDIGEDLLQIGNALNFLGSNSAANEGRIAKFVNRLAGGASILGLSAEQIFGISTALDEVGISAERGSTATIEALSKIAAEPTKFSDILGINGDEFQQQVETNLVDAFGTVIEKVRELEAGGQPAIQTLNQLGLTGAGVREVYGKLSQDFDLVNKRIEQSGVALKNTDSILEEFNQKNQTVGATIDKLKNSIVNLTVSSGFQDFLVVGISGLTKFINVIAAIPSFLKENRIEIGLLIVALVSLNAANIAAAAAALKKAAAEKLAAIASRGLTAQQWLLNAALTANPIGLVIAGVALLTAVFIKAYRSSETFREGVNQLTAKFLEFYNNNLLVRGALFTVIEPIKILYGLFSQGPSFISDYVNSLREGFSRLVLNAQKTGLQLQRALSFGDGVKARLTGEIKDIEDAIKASEVRSAKIKEDAAKREEQRKMKELDDVKAIEERKNDEIKKAEKAKINIRRSSLADLKSFAESEDKVLANLAKEEIKRREQVADAAKKAAEARLKASQNIAKLENELINNTFDRQTAQATSQANSDISGLEGDPDQIDKQTQLIQQALQRRISIIEKERAKAQQDQIAQTVEFQQQLQEVQRTTSLSGLESESNSLSNQFKIDESEVQANLTQATLLLQQELEKREITKKEYDERLKQLELEAREEINSIRNQFFAEQAAINQQVQEEELAQIEERFQSELLRIESDAAAKREKLLEQKELDLIAEEEFENQKKLIEELRIAEQQAAEQQRAEEQAVVIEEAAIQTIENEQVLADQEVAINESKNARIIANEEQTRKQLQAIQNGKLTLLNTFVAGTKRLLTQDTENRKKYGRLIKALALAEVAINLQKELSAISAAAAANPANAITFGAAGISQSAILSAIAVAKAAFAAATIVRQKFEFGGMASGSGVESAESSGTSLPATGSGFALGKDHADGGIKIKNAQGDLMEMQTGEFMLKNGKETYIINRKSSRKFKGALLRASKNSSRFSPTRKRLASAINSYNGFGIPLAVNGGVLTSSSIVGSSPLSVTPLDPPSISIPVQAQSSGDQMRNTQLLFNAIEAIDEKTDAINERIDRITVINDPLEALETGEALKTQQQANEL